AGLDRQEAVAALGVGNDLAGAGEIGVERRVVLVDWMVISPGRVALPQLDQRARPRAAVLVEHAPRQDHPLAQWRALVLRRQIDRVGAGPAIREPRPGRF